MESSTAAASQSTGSTTIADMLGLAAERYGDRAAVRFKRDGAWHDVSFAELGEIVSEIARGLIDLGLQPGDRVSLLCSTRPEWTYADFAITSAGGVVVPIYPTNSPSECAWVAGNSESRFVVCEDATQVAKIDEVRGELPALEAVIAIEPAERARSPLDELRERGRGRDAAEVAERAAAVRPEDPYTFIYTSGTTGPPKGCVLTHGNYRSVLDMSEELGALESEEIVYLFLPLAHAYALLIQLLSVDLGSTIAYWGSDPQQIIPELNEVQPSYLPSVPRIFEKIYTLVTAHGDPAQDQGRHAGRAEGPAAAGRRPGGPGRAPAALRRGRGGAVQERPRRRSAATSSRPTPARRRSPRRSSSSSTRAACRCSRATG